MSERSIEEIRNAFLAIHRVATGRSDRSYMSIPAREVDADLVLSAAIDELEKARADIQRLREAAEHTLKEWEVSSHYDEEEPTYITKLRAALSGAKEAT